MPLHVSSICVHHRGSKLHYTASAYHHTYAVMIPGEDGHINARNMLSF